MRLVKEGSKGINEIIRWFARIQEIDIEVSHYEGILHFGDVCFQLSC